MSANTICTESCLSREFLALGTLNSLRLYGAQPGVAGQAEALVLGLDARLSAFRPGSEIAQINRSAGHRPVAVSEETFGLLKRAKAFSSFSGGAFDISVRPLVELWGIGHKADFVPRTWRVRRTLRLVSFHDLILDETCHTAFLRRTGQAVDLGGIAKGYAADKVRRLLTEAGVQSAMINLGGNLIALGTRPDGEPWRVGVQNPCSTRGEWLGLLALTDKTVVTSGSNERFFIKDGVRYHHILDPRTGSPARSGLLSVTVIGVSSEEADALSTAAFVLGLEQGAALIMERGAEAVFAAEDGRLYLTAGLRDIFQWNHRSGHSSGRLQ